MQIFQQAGRYPDTNLDQWGFPLELLTFLDGFIIHCRDLIGSGRGSTSWTRQLFLMAADGNPVMREVALAAAESNQYLADLGVTSAMLDAVARK